MNAQRKYVVFLRALTNVYDATAQHGITLKVPVTTIDALQHFETG